MKIVKSNRLFIVLLIVGMVFFLSATYVKAENSNPGNVGEDEEDVIENEIEDSDSEEDAIENEVEDSDSEEDVIENEIEDSSDEEDADDSQGEIKQIQNKEQEREQVQNEKELGEAMAEQRRSAVANAVQEMLQMAEKNNGIGQQVKVIAQAQNENQEKMEASLEKVQSRSGFAKFFIGPNYKEIKNAETILEQNREQIKQLNEIKIELINQGDEQTLNEQIQILEQANLEIEDSLKNEKRGFSLFGWLFS